MLINQVRKQSQLGEGWGGGERQGESPAEPPAPTWQDRRAAGALWDPGAERCGGRESPGVGGTRAGAAVTSAASPGCPLRGAGCGRASSQQERQPLPSYYNSRTVPSARVQPPSRLFPAQALARAVRAPPPPPPSALFALPAPAGSQAALCPGLAAPEGSCPRGSGEEESRRHAAGADRLICAHHGGIWAPAMLLMPGVGGGWGGWETRRCCRPQPQQSPQPLPGISSCHLALSPWGDAIPHADPSCPTTVALAKG